MITLNSFDHLSIITLVFIKYLVSHELKIILICLKDSDNVFKS
jgi:hypothetical protein